VPIPEARWISLLSKSWPRSWRRLDEDKLFDLVRRAYPYRNLSRDDYESILDMVSEGMAPERGRFGAYVQRDRVQRRLHARKGHG